MDNYIKVVAAAACVLTNKSLCVGFIDSSLQLDLLVPELATNIDVGCFRSHAEAHDEGTFDKLVWVMTQDLTVLASAWFGFISVDNKVGWSMTEES